MANLKYFTVILIEFHFYSILEKERATEIDHFLEIFKILPLSAATSIFLFV